MFRETLVWSIPATDLCWDGWACYEGEPSGDLRLQFWMVDGESPIAGLGMESSISGRELRAMRPLDLARFLNQVRLDFYTVLISYMGRYEVMPLYTDAYIDPDLCPDN